MKHKRAWELTKSLQGKRTVQCRYEDGHWGLLVDGQHFKSEEALNEYLQTPLFPEFTLEPSQPTLFSQLTKERGLNAKF